MTIFSSFRPIQHIIFISFRFIDAKTEDFRRKLKTKFKGFNSISIQFGDKGLLFVYAVRGKVKLTCRWTFRTFSMENETERKCSWNFQSFCFRKFQVYFSSSENCKKKCKQPTTNIHFQMNQVQCGDAFDKTNGEKVNECKMRWRKPNWNDFYCFFLSAAILRKKKKRKKVCSRN